MWENITSVPPSERASPAGFQYSASTPAAVASDAPPIPIDRAPTGINNSGAAAVPDLSPRPPYAGLPASAAITAHRAAARRSGPVIEMLNRILFIPKCLRLAHDHQLQILRAQIDTVPISQVKMREVKSACHREPVFVVKIPCRELSVVVLLNGPDVDA